MRSFKQLRLAAALLSLFALLHPATHSTASAAEPATGQGPDLTCATEIAKERCSADQWVLLIEPNHSTIGFSIPIMGGITKVTGKFTDLFCVICYTEGDLTASSVKLVAQAASVDTGIDGRDRDLSTTKFFDVVNTPEIIFESERIEQRGNQWVAVGSLTIRGVTTPVESPFVLTGEQKGEGGRPMVGVALSYTLNRHDFGVGSDWVHSAIPGFLGDEVTVEVFMYTRSGRTLEELQSR